MRGPLPNRARGGRSGGPATGGARWPSGPAGSRGSLPPRPLPDVEAYLAEWSSLHGGYDPRRSQLVSRWLAGTYRLASPLVRFGARPAQLTAAGVALTGLAVPAAAAGRRWPLAAAGAVVGAGLLDNVDGCVAILSGRVSPLGAVIDSVADRTGDAVLAGALAAAGAPTLLVAAAIGGLMGLEYTRAVARAAGFTEIGTVTVGERPTRLIVVCAGLVCAGLFPGRRAGFVAAAAAAVAGLALTGQAQLLAVVRGGLR